MTKHFVLTVSLFVVLLAVLVSNMPVKMEAQAPTDWQRPVAVPFSGTSALSQAVDVTGLYPLGLIVPGAWQTATSVTFQGSDRGATFYDMYDALGAEQAAVVAASSYVSFDLDDLASPRYLKIRSGTVISPITQTTAMTLTLMCRTMY